MEFICPKCGTKYNHKRDYCLKCGSILDTELVKEVGHTDADYFYYYFKEYENGKDLAKINIGCIFIPIPMIFYYKLYKEGIIFFVILLISLLSYFIIYPSVGPFGFYLVVFSIVGLLTYHIFMIFKVNEIRKRDALDKISYILRLNEDKTEEEKIELIKKSSKNNISFFIIALIILISLFIIIITY